VADAHESGPSPYLQVARAVFFGVGSDPPPSFNDREVGGQRASYVRSDQLAHDTRRRFNGRGREDATPTRRSHGMEGSGFSAVDMRSDLNTTLHRRRKIHVPNTNRGAT
jgi:hypothetical protein